MAGRKKGALEILPGTLEMLILKALSIGPLHGYAVARRLEQTSEGVLRVEEGTLYPALHRMERRGWIVAEWGQSELNRRAKYYSLSRSGKKALVERSASWERMSGAIARILESPPVPESEA